MFINFCLAQTYVDWDSSMKNTHANVATISLVSAAIRCQSDEGHSSRGSTRGPEWKIFTLIAGKLNTKSTFEICLFKVPKKLLWPASTSSPEHTLFVLGLILLFCTWGAFWCRIFSHGAIVWINWKMLVIIQYHFCPAV